MMWSSSSRLQLSTQRSATPFCQGLSKDVRTGLIFRHRTAAGTSTPYFASRSKIRNLGADRDGRQAVLQFLRERENGVLLISHDRECLDLCEEVRELSNRGLSKFGGGWLAYTEARELALGKIDPAHHAAEHSLFR